MRRMPLRAIGLTVLVLFGLLWLPLSVSEAIRNTLFGTSSLIWAPTRGVGAILRKPVDLWRVSGRLPELEKELDALRLRNEMMEAQMEVLMAVEEYQSVIKDLHSRDDGAPLSEEQAKDFYGDIRAQLSLQLQAVPARVIYRSPSLWSSFIWIDVGSQDNREFERAVIVRDSPVLMGRSLIGVVDYVGKRQSRVRLITDRSLAPSVRVLREAGDGVRRYLAKGELHGSSEPLWRSPSSYLQGVGFNYDYADEYGPARDLRSGSVLGELSHDPEPIIQEGDLLVTTGMDGVFPPGLEVARVSHIDMLKEGSYTYSLQAFPTAGSLNDLSLVFVVPPVGFDPSDQAPRFGYESVEEFEL